MEALNVVANIAAVIQLAVQVTQLSYSCAREIKNASKEQKQYLKEVSSLMDILFCVDEQIISDAEASRVPPPRPACLDDDALEDGHIQLSKLHFELEKRKSRLLRPFQDKELRPHINFLQKLRVTFSDYLSTCTLEAADTTYKKVSHMSHEHDRNLLLTLNPPPEIQLRDKPDPCPDTGSWFLDEKNVHRWIDGSSSLLWCHGPPGVGKSFLASILIDHLSKQQSEAIVMNFFCDFPLQDEHTTVNILRVLLRQLIEQANGETLTSLKNSWEESDVPKSATDIVKSIAKASSQQQIYLVLDAVDEMKTSDEILKHCVDLSKSGIQILISSRNIPHIEKNMSTADQLPILGNSRDLKLYIEHRMQEFDFKDDLAEDDAIFNDIISTSGNLFLLIQLTMDELVGCTSTEQIRKSLDREAFDLQQTFDSILKRIDDQPESRGFLARRLLTWILYAKRRLTMEEIVTAFAVNENGFNHEAMPDADLLLRICMGIVVLNESDNTVRLVHTSAYEYFLALLPPHGSHRDIARTCLWYLNSKNAISEPCASSTELKMRFESQKFLEYSAENWGSHIIDRDSEKDLQPLILGLLNEERARKAAFQALQFRSQFNGALAEELFKSLHWDETALHLAAYWNLVETAETLIQSGSDVSALDSHKWTPLHWACSNEHFPVADLLIKMGADANPTDMEVWTPLFWSSFIGNVELVRLLLKNGADHQFRSSFGWTALHWAVSGGHSGAVQELLEHHSRAGYPIPPLHTMKFKFIIPFQDVVYPVEIAADNYDTDIFNLLTQDLELSNVLGDVKFNLIWTQARFDAQFSDNSWRIMTKVDMLRGRENIVPPLRVKSRQGPNGWYISPGAKRDESLRSEPSRWRSTLLVSAIRDEQFAPMKILVETGSDVNEHNALHIAAHRKDPRYVQFLLQHDADPTKKNARGETALHIAIFNGFLETMKALIRGGSDVNEPMDVLEKYRVDWSSILQQPWPLEEDEKLPHYGLGASPLILASGALYSRGKVICVEVIRELLSNGAEIGYIDYFGKTFMFHAFEKLHFPLVKTLIEFNVPVYDVLEHGQPPLHYLARCPDAEYQTEELKEAVLKLLALGKEKFPGRDFLNEPIQIMPSSEGVATGKLQTPLELSFSHGHWKMMQVLLEVGASLNSLDMTHILDKVVRSLEPDFVTWLCDKGTRYPRDSAMVLVRSFINLRGTAKIDSRELKDRFQRILAIICTAGADINFCGPIKKEGEMEVEEKMTPLTLAATLPGSRDICQDLLRCGSNLYGDDLEALDPILTAAIFGDKEDLEFLMKCSDKTLNSSHWTRHLADVDNTGDPAERICFCLSREGLLNKTNEKGESLLAISIKQQNDALSTALILNGARDETSGKNNGAPNQDSKEENQLRKVVDRNEISRVSALLKQGANPNEKHDSISVLYRAAELGNTPIVQLLLDSGASIEIRDKYGWTPLHIACYTGHKKVVEVLIARGANVNATTSKWAFQEGSRPSDLWKGHTWCGTALHLATMGGYSDIVEILFLNNIDCHVSSYPPVATGDERSWNKLSFSEQSAGPTALNIALEHGTFYGRKCDPLGPERLQIAQLLVNAGLMVQGKIRWFNLDEMLCFKEFPGLWDVLVAGDSKDEQIPQKSD